MKSIRWKRGAIMFVVALTTVTAAIVVAVALIDQNSSESTTPGAPMVVPTQPAVTEVLVAVESDSPDTTVAVLPSSQPDADGPSFEATFNGRDDLVMFRHGLYHRGDEIVDTTEWNADHALLSGGDCSPPDQTHEVHRDAPAESFYVCTSVGGDPEKGHLMTSVGDTSPYSIAWFSPNESFTTERSVSWDVGVTDLGDRQWWEVMLVSVDGPDLACEIGFPCGLTTDHHGYPVDSVVIANNNRSLRSSVDNSGWTNPADWRALCNQGADSLDQEGCDSVALRRSFELTDNDDGTMTLTMSAGDALMYEWSIDGSFPEGPWKVMFKDHDYTPTKDGPVAGFTWHWDNIVVD